LLHHLKLSLSQCKLPNQYYNNQSLLNQSNKLLLNQSLNMYHIPYILAHNQRRIKNRVHPISKGCYRI
jgi:hypothetical protein